MDVKLNPNIDPVRYGKGNPIKPRPMPLAGVTAQFDGADGLERSLQATPEVRPQTIARAQQLIGDVAYPPPKTIRRIAALLAMHLDGDDQF